MGFANIFSYFERDKFMVDLTDNRTLRLPRIFILGILNIFFLQIDLYPQEIAPSESVSKDEKEYLDVNKINSSVDAGSFYSVDLSIKQLEENMAKMAQELNGLKQHVEFAKLAEQKGISQIQKLEKENQRLEQDVQNLEKENMKFRQSWLDNSLDNSWTGSSSRMETPEDKSHDIESTSTATTTTTVIRAEPNQTVTVTPQVATPQVSMPQAIKPQVPTQNIGVQHPPAQPVVRQDVVVQVVEYKNN